jgi:hypothetical protein
MLFAFAKVLGRDAWYARPVSVAAVAEVMARAMEDEELRARPVADPTSALADHDLSPAEAVSFLDGELRRLLLRERPAEV